MTKLDLVIERLRALSEPEQDLFAKAIEEMLAQSALSPEQWAEVEAELAADDGVRLAHGEVLARLRARFPG